MTIKENDPKLHLRRETLRELTVSDLRTVAGGPGSGGGATSSRYTQPSLGRQ